MVHLVFDGGRLLHPQLNRTLETFIDGNQQKLTLEVVRNSSIARVDHSKLNEILNLTVSMRDLKEPNPTLDTVSFHLAKADYSSPG